MGDANLDTDHLDELTEFSAPPDRYVGKVLAGRYRVLRLLGEGGMGAIYEAEHTVIGRKVAVKMLHAQFASETTVVKRFTNEARAAAMIGHPNILECTDIGQGDDGAPFLVLELLRGGDLHEELEKRGPLQVSRLVAIIQQTASALGAAHDKGIIHRDMKPENIYLCSDKADEPHVKILDFGISKFASHLATSPGTAAGSAMGTPFYMAPEQLMDASTVDPRADIYALGVIMYQCLTGTLPFMADSLPGIALQISSGAYTPLEQLRPGLPSALVEVIAKAMATHADDRYTSMAELSEALRPFAHVRDAEFTSQATLPGTALAASLVRARTAEENADTEPPAAGSAATNGAESANSPKPRAIAASIAVLVCLAGAAFVMTRGESDPPNPAPAVAGAPASDPDVLEEAAGAPEPAPDPNTPEVVSVHLEADTPGATAVIRGRRVTLPHDAELTPRDEAELIEFDAESRQGLRFTVTLDAARRLTVQLPVGEGMRDATEAELHAALAGEPFPTTPTGSAAPGRDGRRTPRDATMRTATAMTRMTTTTMVTPTGMTARPSTMRRRVYSGPSGAVPSL